MLNVFLDTETTGLNPGQICELSLIAEDDFNFKFAKNYFFRVSAMEEGAEAVHGLSQTALIGLSKGLEFKDYKDELYSILSNSVIIAHNESFDEKFISSEFWRLGVSFKPSGRLDTMSYFKDVLKIPAKSKRYGPYKNPKLSEVMDYFHVDNVKVNELCNRLFGSIKVDYHDSRFDTTAMYVAVNLQREVAHGIEGDWHKNFCL